MHPKVDSIEVRLINIKVFGGEGEGGPASTFDPKLRPLGLVIIITKQKIKPQISSGKWKGIRVLVNPRCQNRNADVTVIPTSSALLIKEIEGEKEKKEYANLTLEQVIKMARALEEKSLVKNLKEHSNMFQALNYSQSNNWKDQFR